MGFNLLQPESDAPMRRSSDGNPAEVDALVMQIFRAQAESSGGLRAGSPFASACKLLAKTFAELHSLDNPAMEGRAFELFDTKHEGILDAKSFLDGVHKLLQATEAPFANLANRLHCGVPPKVTPEYSHVKRVAILGAGVAGLQVAERLRSIGIACTIFERAANVGGVWRANYADFSLQVPRELYQFPGFPWPAGKNWKKFSEGHRVQEYIEAYAAAYELKSLCKFNTIVHALEPLGDSRGWRVRFSASTEQHQAEEFDFVIVATGMYSSTPNMPSPAGMDNFVAAKGHNAVLHSSEFRDKNVTNGKRVLVVGGGKSAIDCAVACVNGGATETTLLYREAHWPVPRYILGLIPFKFATYSRFGHALLPVHYDISSFAWWLHAVFTPIKWLVWRLVEQIFIFQFGLKGDQVPKSKIEVDLFTGGQIVTYEATRLMKKGLLKESKNAIAHFSKSGVVLVDGRELECDMVVFGTGFAKQYDILDRLLQDKMMIEKDGLYLYRNMVPVGLPDLAFIGSEISTFNNILTHGLQAVWLAKLLQNEIQLPSNGQMSYCIEREAAWKRSWMPPISARASIHQLHMMQYHDQLMRDLGESRYRKSNIFAEIFSPYTAEDYAALFGQQTRGLWSPKILLAVGGVLALAYTCAAW